ncbi:PepSY domain-containing protein [Metabacillus idriensis]|uniref:PepSY domain-containing protein n=1 Tax=Metabacillus idriensis TaxID=324768 RepID=UPI002813BD0E|nr:PepSY domain-containing protein [Metabacillus idriensis]MDR0136895.1 PepSY domain-containing protein [Metabacillus idriensis]
MNRKWTILSVLVIIGVIGIIGIASAMKGDVKVTEAEARNLVEAHYTGTIKEMVLTKLDDREVYQVELEEKKGLYTLEVDAATGSIQNLKQVKKADLESEKEPALSVAEAKKLAEETYSGNVQTMTLQGKTYSITLLTKTEEIKVEMNADSGEIKSEDKSSIEKTKQPVKLTEEQAEKIALAEVKGKIEDIDLEEEDGSVFYEVEIESGQQEATIQIDAFTGKILSVAIENEED